ncbi:MAG: peptidyl-prolyl cis-trans isomerase, partial [Candidatus Eisenbacteria bacterium]|nr:peptidyl-prolyl cis-trans isomerase [Candidatus Eisenbacteria bacterium]
LLGGELTLGEFAEQVDRRPPFVRPVGGNTDDIVLTIEDLGREKVYELEFNKLGLRDKPFFRNLVRKKREELILSQLFVAIQDTVTITREEVEEHYEANRDAFMTAPVINLAVMTFDSVNVARRAAKQLEEGRDFESVAVDFSIYSGSETGFDTTGFITKDKAVALFEALWETPIGSTAGPILDSRRWKVAKLLARQDPRLLNLEEATPMIVERLGFMKADVAFAALIEDLRSKASIAVNEEALRAVVLPALQ